jgi:hypothetical protein
MSSPLHSRTTYREDYCHEHPRAVTFGAPEPRGGDADLDNSTVSVKTTIRNRELEVSAGPLGPGLTLSTYRDAYCTPHLGTQSQSIQGAGATRTLAGPDAAACTVARTVAFPPVPRTWVFGPEGTTGLEVSAAPSAAPFYSRTTYRDSFADPIHASAGPLLGLGVSPEALGNTRMAPGAPRRAAQTRAAPRPAPSAPGEPFKRSLNYSRTTYQDAYGVPFPVVVVEPEDEEESEPPQVEAPAGRSLAGSGQRKPSRV